MLRINSAAAHRMAPFIGARYCATAPKNYEEIASKLQEISQQQRGLHERIGQFEKRWSATETSSFCTLIALITFSGILIQSRA